MANTGSRGRAEFRAGAVVGRGLSVYFRNIPLFLTLAILALVLFAGDKAANAAAFSAFALVWLVLGVYINVVLGFIIPAIVTERLGPIAGMVRSLRLTRGYRWRVLGVFVLAAIIYFVASIVIGAMFGVLTGAMVRSMDPAAIQADPFSVLSNPAYVVVQVIGGVVSLLPVGLVPAIMTVGYHDLRIAHEGDDPA